MRAKKQEGRVETEAAKVLIVDDHPIVRQGLAKLINEKTDLNVTGEASSPHEALDMIAKQAFDVAVVDLSLEHTSGIELIKDIKVRSPDLPVLVLSMHEESFYAERALRAGAKGYIMKQVAPEQLIGAIRRVLSGQIYLSDKMTTQLLSGAFEHRAETNYSPIERLSDRELEVFELIGQGLTTRQIAKKLHLSVKTIESHRANIKDKMKIVTGTELIQHAIRWVEQSG
jgi:DNA-binding NarL/FixJ family response regulator